MQLAAADSPQNSPTMVMWSAAASSSSCGQSSIPATPGILASTSTASVRKIPILGYGVHSPRRRLDSARPSFQQPLGGAEERFVIVDDEEPRDARELPRDGHLARRK